jgi:hypothetical protein
MESWDTSEIIYTKKPAAELKYSKKRYANFEFKTDRFKLNIDIQMEQSSDIENLVTEMLEGKSTQFKELLDTFSYYKVDAEYIADALVFVINDFYPKWTIVMVKVSLPNDESISEKFVYNKTS